MKTTSIYKSADGQHEWLMFGRDDQREDNIIDSNQYMIRIKNESILLDPGGIAIFPQMLDAVVKQTELEKIKYIFASHQDPDIVSSLGLWDQLIKHAKLWAPSIWEGFIRHFGAHNIDYLSIPDAGGQLNLGGVNLQAVPAHYMHASGNFNLYDPVSKILFSGDLGGSTEHGKFPIYVEDFEDHIQHIELFHKRWMPSNRHKLDWIKRIREMDIEMMVPQHGRIYRRKEIGLFLDWLEVTDVGVVTNEL